MMTKMCSDLFFVPVNLGKVAILLGEFKSVALLGLPGSSSKSSMNAAGRTFHLDLTVDEVHNRIKYAIEEFRIASK